MKIRSIKLLFANPKHEIKRFFRYLILKNERVINSEKYIERSEHERSVIRICRNIILSSDTELLTSPKTGKRYANNQLLSIHIILNADSVDVIKKRYHQNVPLSPKSHSKILNMFDGHVENRRQIMENEIRSNLKCSLESIEKETKKQTLKEESEL